MPRRPPAVPAALRCATLLPALLLLACGPAPPPPGDVSLLPLAEAAVEGGAPAAVAWRGGAALHPADAPARVAVAESERLALLTRRGVAWEMPVRLRPGDRLRWSVAMGVGGRRADTGLLARVGRLGVPVLLGQVHLVGSEGWQEGEIVVEEAFDGRLRLESVGPHPLAWAEVRLLRAREGGAGESGTAGSRRPNVVLVSLDTLRADRLSLYGHSRATSPHLDAFAADALVFERALSTSTWTLPGHGSLFTGLVPDRHRLTAVDTTLDPGAVTLAQRLRRLGYRTVALTDGGFLGPRWGLSRGFDRYDTTPGQPWEPKDAAVIAARAAAWMEDNAFEPYFLFLHSYETHQPYVNREGFADPWLAPAGGGGGAMDDGGAVGGGAPNVLTLNPENLSTAELERIRALYDGGVRRMDHYLGALLERWRDHGRLARTAVIVTSDHGEELGEHGDFEHALGKVYDENVRVPMIVRPPGGVAGGGRRPAVAVSSLDVAPTVLAWAGAADPSLVGRPLVELAAAEGELAGERPGADRPVVVQGINSLPELDEWWDRLDRGPWSVLSDRRRGRASFFDRGADPAMVRPLAPAVARDDPAVPAVGLVRRLGLVLAWSSGRSTHAVPLPPAATAVRVEGGSGVVPRGVWDGLVWRPLAMGESVALNPGVPAVLAFDVEGRGRERWVGLEGVGEGEGEGVLRLGAGRAYVAEGWNPVEGPLPEVGEIFPAAAVLEVGSLELSEEARKELEALGYL